MEWNTIWMIDLSFDSYSTFDFLSIFIFFFLFSCYFISFFSFVCSYFYSFLLTSFKGIILAATTMARILINGRSKLALKLPLPLLYLFSTRMLINHHNYAIDAKKHVKTNQFETTFLIYHIYDIDEDAIDLKHKKRNDEKFWPLELVVRMSILCWGWKNSNHLFDDGWNFLSLFFSANYLI